MAPLFVIKRQPLPNICRGLHHRIIRFEIHLLILQAAPQPSHKHIVDPTALAVHTDPDAFVFEHSGKLVAGELAPLITVEYLRCIVSGESVFQRLGAEPRIQAVGEPTAQYFARVPVDDSHQIQEALAHRNVRDVPPHLVGSVNNQALEQVRINPVPLVRPGGSGLGMQRFYPHQAHQPLYPFTVYLDAVVIP